MIQLLQQSGDISSILNEYPQESMEFKIIDKMNKSEKKYRFQNKEHLKFEVDLRDEIIKSSVALFKSHMDFAVFRKTRGNPQYWERLGNGGLKLKNGVKASEAISDIFSNGRMYATECATAMVIVYYMAILQVFPQELFNKVFDNITLMNWHYLDRNISEAGMLNEKSDELPGDRRYFKNPDVDLTTPEWQGENVIDLGNGTFYGHGIGIHNSQTIINALNENRKEGSTTSAYLMEYAGNLDYKKLFKILIDYNQDDAEIPA